jgi:ribosome-binding protein aMBF1 (putative translation factor)
LGYSSRIIRLKVDQQQSVEMAKAKFSPTYTKLRLLLTESRMAAGLSQVDLASKLGKPQSYVSKVESGERRIDVVEFVEFVRALGADPVRMLRATLATG